MDETVIELTEETLEEAARELNSNPEKRKRIDELFKGSYFIEDGENEGEVRIIAVDSNKITIHSEEEALFLSSCLLNRYQKAKSIQCGRNKEEDDEAV